jgi:hypothetical protein
MEINFHIEIIFFSINWWMVTVNAQQGGAQVMYIGNNKWSKLEFHP